MSPITISVRLEPLVDNLLDEMKKVVMQPFSTLLDVFPRFVRELSRDQGKEVELSIQGGDIEIDRRIFGRDEGPAHPSGEELSRSRH